jgi:hypothetical protein
MITLVSSPKQHLPKDMQHSVCTSSDPLNDSITCARYVTFRNYERSYEIKAEVGGPELLELNALSIFILCKGVLAFF